MEFINSQHFKAQYYWITSCILLTSPSKAFVQEELTLLASMMYGSLSWSTQMIKLVIQKNENIALRLVYIRNLKNFTSLDMFFQMSNPAWSILIKFLLLQVFRKFSLSNPPGKKIHHLLPKRIRSNLSQKFQTIHNAIIRFWWAAISISNL